MHYVGKLLQYRLRKIAGEMEFAEKELDESILHINQLNDSLGKLQKEKLELENHLNTLEN